MWDPDDDDNWATVPWPNDFWPWGLQRIPGSFLVDVRAGLVPAAAVLPQLPLVRVVGVERRQWLTHAIPRPDRNFVCQRFLEGSGHLEARWVRRHVRSAQLMANENDRTGEIYVRFEIRDIVQPYGPPYANVRWHISLIRLVGPDLRYVRERLDEFSDELGLAEMFRDLFLYGVPWPQPADVAQFLVSGQTHLLCLAIADELVVRWRNSVVHVSSDRLHLDLPVFEPPPDLRT